MIRNTKTEEHYLGFDILTYLSNQDDVQRIITAKKPVPLRAHSQTRLPKSNQNHENAKQQSQQKQADELAEKPTEKLPEIQEVVAQDQEVRQNDQIVMKVSKPKIGLCVNMVNIVLVGSKVQDIRADAIIVPYNLKAGLRIYPAEYIKRNQKEYDISNSIKRRVRDKQDEFFGLNSSNPNFKGYFFVRIDKKDDIRERISTVLTAIMFEHLNQVAIPYLNDSNTADKGASQQMINCLIEELSWIDPVRHNLRITLFAETKQKFKSLWYELNERICSGIAENDIRCI